MVSQSSRSPGTTPGTVRGTPANSRAEANVRWQLAFGMVLVVAVILAVMVMVTSSLERADNAAIMPTATPALLSELMPNVEAPPSPSPTPDPVVEQIKILYMNTKDLTPENAWPTMRVGESINVNAVVYPMDILNPVVTWECSDEDGVSMQYTVNSDDTVTLTCVSAQLGRVQLTARCYGTSVTITIYLREAA